MASERKGFSLKEHFDAIRKVKSDLLLCKVVVNLGVSHQQTLNFKFQILSFKFDKLNAIDRRGLIDP